MNRSQRISFLLVALSSFLVAFPVMAASPLDVHIEVSTLIDTSVPDPFVASGPAIDSGLLCSIGLVSDASVDVVGPPDGEFSVLRILKRFSCDDGSGTFDIKLVVRLDLETHETTANWVVVGGTGDYAGIHGNGKLAGTPIDPGISILDVYDGKVH
jgi:hypothetical protein